MIFVTVGTTLPFDDLIRKMDRLVETGKIAERVVYQIGNGTYIPTRSDHFRFTPHMDEWTEKASVIVSHGGTGTVCALLAEGKPFVAVANPAGAGDHQADFLSRLSRSVSFLWTRNLDELGGLIQKAPKFQITVATGPRLVNDLRRYLLES